MTTDTIKEKFMPPKELETELLARFGIKVTADYLRAVRAETIRQSAGIFVRGHAKATDVMNWMRSHPEFKRRW